MGKTKVFLCSEEETVELGEARVELEFEDRPRELPIELSAVILRDVDFPAESAADAAVTSLQADVEFYQKNSDYWRKTYNLLMEQRRRDWSERIDLVAQNDELRSEVERLRQSRKEQAEKHRQKMRNLQQNFEAREQAKNRNTQLQRQVKNLTRALETSRADAEYWHGRFIEVEECLGNSSELAGQRDQWKEAYHRTLARSVEYADEMQDLRGELAVAKAERDRLLADINCFMEDFAEGATIINSAVEDWNAKVPE